MKDEWKIKPYLGVLPRVFKALKIDVTKNHIWLQRCEFDKIKQEVLAVTNWKPTYQINCVEKQIFDLPLKWKFVVSKKKYPR